MKRILSVSLILITILFACHSAKKSSKPKPKTSKPKTSVPSKPKTTPVATKDPNKELIFVQSDRLSPVLEKAQKEKKVVFVECHAKWCAPCKVMEEEVFTQKPVFTYLNKNFINFKVDLDTEAGKTIASIYDVVTLPTVLFLDPQGVVLERKTGMANPSDLTTMGNSALKKMNK